MKKQGGVLVVLCKTVFNKSQPSNIQYQNFFFFSFAEFFPWSESFVCFCLFPLLLVTVCPCNVRGNCKMAAKQLQGMPTIQSAVGILLGTFAVIGKQRGCWKQDESLHNINICAIQNALQAPLNTVFGCQDCTSHGSVVLYTTICSK